MKRTQKGSDQSNIAAGFKDVNRTETSHKLQYNVCVSDILVRNTKTKVTNTYTFFFCATNLTSYILCFAEGVNVRDVPIGNRADPGIDSRLS